MLTHLWSEDGSRSSTEKRSRANEKIQAALQALSISLYEIPSFILTEKFPYEQWGKYVISPGYQMYGN